MKIRIMILTCLIVVTGCINNTSNNDKNSTVSVDTLQIIRSLKKEYSEINSKLAVYTKVEKNVLGESAEGGVINAFFDKKELKKVITIFYGETGKAENEYYFNSGRVFYVLSTEYFYNKPIYIKGSKIVSTKENKYYLVKNQLIKWQNNNGKSVNINAKEYQIEKKKLFEDIERVIKSIKE